MSLEDTGERFLPWKETSDTYFEHLHRYALARKFTLEKKVLDLACGEGYGVNILAQNAKFVTGIDYDEKTINHAKKTYKQKNIEFLKGSMTNVPIKNSKKFDVIVCFEAIEHVDEQEKVLQEVKRLLKDDGIFVASTPNKIVYSNEQIEPNPFHKKELTIDEFQNLLKPYFTNVKVYGQKALNTSNIWPLNTNSKEKFEEIIIKKSKEQFEFIKNKEAKYFIAISTDKINKIKINTSFLFDPESSKMHTLRLEHEIKEKNDEISKASKHISKIQKDISRSKSQLEEIEERRPKYYSYRL